MKGLLWLPNAVVVGFVVMLMFGAVVFDLTINSARCVQGDCEALTETVLSTVISPDEKIYSGVRAIQQVQDNPEQFLEPNQLVGMVRTQILIGLFSFFVIFAVLVFIVWKVTPSSNIDLIAKAFGVLLVILLLAVLQFGYMMKYSEEGITYPFRGIRALISDPGVMFDVIEDSGILPSNVTSDDIAPTEPIAEEPPPPE